MRGEAERALRAARRASYPGEIVRANAPKPPLYADMSLIERLVRMTQLCRAQWLASGRTLETRPRSEWPGEVFRIDGG